MSPDKDYDLLPGLVFRFRLDGTLSQTNRSFRAEFGYEEQGVLQTLDQVLPVFTRIFLQTHLFPLLRLQRFAEEIFLGMKHKSGREVPVLLNFRETGLEEEEYWAFGMVVSQRKKFEDELVQTKKNLEKSITENTELTRIRAALDERARQLDYSLHQLRRHHHELRQLNKVVTHDLQEPLRKLSVYKSMIQDPSAMTTDEVIMIAEKSSTAVEQLKLVVNGLQEFVWLTESTTMSAEVRLGDIIQLSLAQYREANQESDLAVRVGNLPSLKGSPEQLIQLFLYLLDNAAKFRSAAPPVVDVTSEIVTRNSFRHMEGKYEYREYLQVKLTDNGTGFDPTHRESVFDVFTKLHHGEGQGLGLALSRKIMENHGGQISAETTPGQGTTIILEFPIDRNMKPG